MQQLVNHVSKNSPGSNFASRNDNMDNNNDNDNKDNNNDKYNNNDNKDNNNDKYNIGNNEQSPVSLETVKTFFHHYSMMNAHCEVVKELMFGALLLLLTSVENIPLCFQQYRENIPFSSQSTFKDGKLIVWIRRYYVNVNMGNKHSQDNIYGKNNDVKKDGYNSSTEDKVKEYDLVGMYSSTSHHPALHAFITMTNECMDKFVDPSSFLFFIHNQELFFRDKACHFFMNRPDVDVKFMDDYSLRKKNKKEESTESTEEWTEEWNESMLKKIDSSLTSLSQYSRYYGEQLYRSEPFFIFPRTVVNKTIFLTWKDETSLPEKVVQNWKTLNPGYNVLLFGDARCTAFLTKEFSADFAEFFETIPYGALKADFWRLCILYRFGGVYVDVDVQPMGVSFDTILQDCDVFTCMDLSNGATFQAIMSFPAYHPVLLECIQTMYSRKYEMQGFREYHYPNLPFHLDSYMEWSGTRDLHHALQKYLGVQNLQGDRYYTKYNGNKNDAYGYEIVKLAKENMLNKDYYDCMVVFHGTVYFRSRYRDYKSDWMGDKEYNKPVGMSSGFLPA